MIGETVIDIEDRYFNDKFRKLVNIPIETQELFI